MGGESPQSEFTDVCVTQIHAHMHTHRESQLAN